MKRTIQLPLHIPTIIFYAVVAGLFVFFIQFVLATGDNTNFIYVCADTDNPTEADNIRFIPPNESCNSSETLLKWNKKGSPGTRVFIENISDIEDFTGADLRYRNFSGADLSGTNFGSSSFLGSNLSKVNFTNSGLAGTNLNLADLSYVNFTGADLLNANGLSTTTRTGII